jgi:hypothetical protein
VFGIMRSLRCEANAISAYRTVCWIFLLPLEAHGRWSASAVLSQAVRRGPRDGRWRD